MVCQEPSRAMNGARDAGGDGLVNRYGARSAVVRCARGIRLPLLSVCLLALALTLSFSLSVGDFVLLLDRAMTLLVELPLALALAFERRA